METIYSLGTMRISDIALKKAQDIAKAVTDGLGGRGIFGVEFFVKGDEVYFSELSPRPHDTGMVTLITQSQSEFALDLRAILNLPLNYQFFSAGASGAYSKLKVKAKLQVIRKFPKVLPSYFPEIPSGRAELPLGERPGIGPLKGHEAFGPDPRFLNGKSGSSTANTSPENFRAPTPGPHEGLQTTHFNSSPKNSLDDVHKLYHLLNRREATSHHTSSSERDAPTRSGSPPHRTMLQSPWAGPTPIC